MSRADSAMFMLGPLGLVVRPGVDAVRLRLLHRLADVAVLHVAQRHERRDDRDADGDQAVQVRAARLARFTLRRSCDFSIASVTVSASSLMAPMLPRPPIPPVRVHHSITVISHYIDDALALPGPTRPRFRAAARHGRADALNPDSPKEGLSHDTHDSCRSSPITRPRSPSARPSLLLAIVVSSTWIIRENESGLVIKQFGPPLAAGRLIALDGEAGYQARLLPPGWHFGLWRWQYKVVKVPMVVVPARRDRAGRRRRRRADPARAHARHGGGVRQLPGRGGVPARRRRARPPARVPDRRARTASTRRCSRW